MADGRGSGVGERRESHRTGGPGAAPTESAYRAGRDRVGVGRAARLRLPYVLRITVTTMPPAASKPPTPIVSMV